MITSKYILFQPCTRLLLIFVILITLSSNKVFSDDGYFRNGLVIIKVEGSTGTGFLIEDNGDFFVYTNAHVIGDCEGLKLLLLDGTELNPVSAIFSSDRDVVKIQIKEKPNENPKFVSFAFFTGNPEIGQEIVVYGNSQGSGVFTELKGNILGVGPTEIEVNAAFVSGNSGSPIITKSGSVVGIATYATRVKDPKDWTLQDTRFSKIRRFGIRINGIEWSDASVKDVATRITMLEDIELYLHQFYTMSLWWTTSDTWDRVEFRQFSRFYDSKREALRYNSDKWPIKIHKFLDLYSLAKSRYFETVLEKTKYQNKSDKYQDELKQKEIKEKFKVVSDNLLSEPRDILAKADWKTGELKRRAEELLRVNDYLIKLYLQIRESPTWRSKGQADVLFQKRVMHVESLKEYRP